MRAELFWYITQHGVVIPNRFFRTTCHYHLQGSRIPRRKGTNVSYVNHVKCSVNVLHALCSGEEYCRRFSVVWDVMLFELGNSYL